MFFVIDYSDRLNERNVKIDKEKRTIVSINVAYDTRFDREERDRSFISSVLIVTRVIMRCENGTSRDSNYCYKIGRGDKITLSSSESRFFPLIFVKASKRYRYN